MKWLASAILCFGAAIFAISLYRYTHDLLAILMFVGLLATGMVLMWVSAHLRLTPEYKREVKVR